VRVETLSTARFRNLDHPEINFAPGVNLFVGDNGQGKTNLLEAVFLFKFGRSFRTHRDTEMIRFGEAFCRVETSCSFAGGHIEDFSVSIERNGDKRFKIAGNAIGKVSNLIGRYPVVLFGPQDLRLTSGFPSDRRRFVDMVGSMADKSYIRILRDYRRVVNQRNAALKARASRGERDVWNTKLVESGCALLANRIEITKLLKQYMLVHAARLDTPFAFSVEYDSDVVYEGTMLAGNGREPGIDEMKTIFETKLFALEEEELRRGSTMVGPHLDDVAIRIEGNEARIFGSQGQKRLLAILMKLAELTHLESRLNEPCLLLLDDVFSEFDKETTERLQGLLGGDRQVWVTSPVPLVWTASRDVRTFALQAGRVTAC
jgi:DNA replication and repair protein RecF